MKRKKVAVIDEYLDKVDTWRNLFYFALKRESDVIMVRFFSDLFQSEEKIDVIVYMKRQEKKSLEELLSFFGKFLKIKILVIGGKSDELTFLNQMDFSSEENFIKAIIG